MAFSKNFSLLTIVITPAELKLRFTQSQFESCLKLQSLEVLWLKILLVAELDLLMMLQGSLKRGTDCDNVVNDHKDVFVVKGDK